MQASVEEHRVIESKPDNAVEDLRHEHRIIYVLHSAHKM